MLGTTSTSPSQHHQLLLYTLAMSWKILFFSIPMPIPDLLEYSMLLRNSDGFEKNNTIDGAWGWFWSGTKISRYEIGKWGEAKAWKWKWKWKKLF